MHLFKDLDPSGGHSVIAAAAERLHDRLTVLASPRSLCELRADSDDYQWLCDWAQAVTGAHLKVWLLQGGPLAAQKLIGRLNSLEAVGLLLLLTAAEVARRDSPPHGLWDAVRCRFHPDAQAFLFDQGTPAPLFKAAMEATALRLHLRHAIGEEGVQRYYLTVHLQIGLTRRALRRLAEALVGMGVPAAAEYLLDRAHGCDAFIQFWQAMARFRHKQITEDDLRRALDATPWALPEWADELVQRARDPVRDEPGAPGGEASSEEDGPLVHTPRLCWDPPAEPFFVCAVSVPSGLDLVAPHYELYAGPTAVLSLFRQPDGSYQHPPEITLPARHSEYVMQLRDEAGDVAADFALSLWPQEEEIAVFQLPSGRRLDAWGDSMVTTRSYALVTAVDLDVTPAPDAWCTLGGEHKLWSVPAGWPAKLEVRMEGEQFWTPLLVNGPRGRVDPEWAARTEVQVALEPVHDGLHLRPELRHLPAGVEVDFIRVGRQPLDVIRHGSSVVIPSFPLSPESAARNLEFVIGLRRELERVRLRRVVKVHAGKAARLTDVGWKWLSKESVLAVNEAAGTPMQIFPASGQERTAVVLLEGDTFWGPVRTRPRPMGSLAGYGARLFMQDVLYNPLTEPAVLAGSVIHPGIVRGAVAADGWLQLRLNRPLEPGQDHAVIVWEPGARPIVFPADEIVPSSPRTWDVPADFNPLTMVVAVAYQGVRLGACWSEQIARAVAELRLSRAFACEAAAMIRWLHLPILQDRWLKAVRTFASLNPTEVLSAWLVDSGLPGKLRFAAAGEEWLAAARQVYWAWEPSRDQASAIRDSLVDEVPEPPLMATVRLLMRMDPLLMARVVQACYASRDPEERQQLESSICLTAGLSTRALGSQLRQREDEMLTEAARILGADPNFLQAGICLPVERSLWGEPMRRHTERNLALALGFAPVRNYLGLQLLRSIVRRM